MGNIATPEFLLARWEELSLDPSLENLPYKIELNAWGKVEMGPPSVPHVRHQTAVAIQPRSRFPVVVVLPDLTGEYR